MTDPARYADALLAWFDLNGRHDLPWQHPRTPYRVWLSEIMLQQTQVRVVIPYFERFVAALPDLRALAEAPQDEVLALWSGLGYYARARNLHAAAKFCLAQYDGELPRDLDALTALPGIGRSTAGAILSQAWNDAQPILDGNVKRVLARVFGIEGWPGTSTVEKKLWSIAASLLPQGANAARMADYTQAQMDFGATLCSRHDPACVLCPLQNDCIARREGRTDEWPTPKPGKTLPERSAVVLLLRDGQGRVLMQRRPPGGIWASLWSLPETEDRDLARMWFESRIAGAGFDDSGRHEVGPDDGGFDAAEILDPIAHGFSHYRLTLQPIAWRNTVLRDAVRDDVDMRWVAREDLASLGIPAPIRNLIERVFAAG
jgi:A/G-specific adenine glycosylase